MEIQPEIKVKSRERKRERRRKRERDTGGARVSRNQAGRLVREAGPRSWPHPLLFRRPFILLIKHGDQWVTQNYVAFATQTFCISFCIQKVSGDLHYLLAKRLVNTFWLSSLMNVNFVSPEVFFFNLHLLKALKLHLYRTKAQWVITKKVLNSKI